jgi:ribonuclease R
MEEQILNLLRQPDYTPLDLSEMLRKLGLPRHQQRQLEQTLAHLERTGQIARIKQGNRYALPIEADLVPGRIRMNRQGVGFLQPDDPKMPSLRIPSDATGTAMHGDQVLVRRDVRPRAIGRRAPDEATGKVVLIRESALNQLFVHL